MHGFWVYDKILYSFLSLGHTLSWLQLPQCYRFAVRKDFTRNRLYRVPVVCVYLITPQIQPFDFHQGAWCMTSIHHLPYSWQITNFLSIDLHLLVLWGVKTQHIQVFEVPADQRVPPRQYVQTQIDQAMKGCECPLPRALGVKTFSCRRCPALPFCPTDPSCRYPPGPVKFYDATPPPCLDIHSQADVFSISFVPTPNGLVQHIQLRTGIPIGMKRAQYEPPYTPRVAPLYLRETPFPSALLPADGEWVDPRSNEGCGATWLQSCVELYDASDDVSIDF